MAPPPPSHLRVDQVETKIELNAERACLGAGEVPVKTADVRAYYERELDFRDQRAENFARDSQILGQGSQQLSRQFDGNRDLEMDLRSEQFVAYARLDQNTRAGNVSASHYADRREGLDRTFEGLQAQDVNDHGVYWGVAATQRDGQGQGSFATMSEQQSSQQETSSHELSDSLQASAYSADWTCSQTTSQGQSAGQIQTQSQSLSITR